MNLKTKTSQNRQKIEQYGSPTTKELKKKHLSILVGGVEMSSQGRENCGKVVAGGQGWARWQLVEWWSHICVQINQEEQLGCNTDHTTQGSSMGK